MSALDALRGRLVLTVPEAGRLLYGIGRDAAYAAAERGEIPVQRVGRTLRVPTHAALKQLGMSDDLVGRVLGITPGRVEVAPARATTAEPHALPADERLAAGLVAAEQWRRQIANNPKGGSR